MIDTAVIDKARIAGCLSILALALTGCAQPSADHDHDHVDEHAHQHEGTDGTADDLRQTVLDPKTARDAGIITAAVAGGPIVESLTTMGSVNVQAGAQALVAARYPGVVRSLGVQIGDRVSRGAVLATIESNLSLSRYSVSSPIAGVVTELQVDVGQSVDGDTLLRIVDTRRLRVDLQLFGNELARVNRGQSVLIAAAHGGEPVQARITRIQPSIDRATQAAIAQVDLPPDAMPWPPGTAVTGHIVLAAEQVAIRVPRSALQTLQGRDVVFVRRGDIFEARAVEIGRADESFLEVRAGLSAGEEIVVQQSFLIKADIEKSSAVHDH